MYKILMILIVMLVVGCASKEPVETTPLDEAESTQQTASSEPDPVAEALEQPTEHLGQPTGQQREIYTGTLPVKRPSTTVVVGSNKAPVIVAPQQPQPSKPVAPMPVASSAQAQYDQALHAYKQREFAKSQQMFKDFIKTYPQNKLMPNALYWEAETLYARGKYVDAIFIFKEVHAKYGKSGKAPDALLKAAMAYKNLGDKDNSRLHLQILAEDYPNSNALKRSKELGLM